MTREETKEDRTRKRGGAPAGKGRQDAPTRQGELGLPRKDETDWEPHDMRD